MTNQTKIIVARLSILALVQILGLVGYLGILQGNAGEFVPQINNKDVSEVAVDDSNINILGFMPSEEGCEIQEDSSCEIDLHFNLESVEKISRVEVYLTNNSRHNNIVDTQDVVEQSDGPVRLTSSVPAKVNNFNIVKVATISNEQIKSVQKVGILVNDVDFDKLLETSLNSLNNDQNSQVKSAVSTADITAGEDGDETETVTAKTKVTITASAIPTKKSTQQTVSNKQTQVQLIDSVSKVCQNGFNGPNNDGLCTGIVDTENPINFSDNFVMSRWFSGATNCPSGFDRWDAVNTADQSQWNQSRLHINSQDNSRQLNGTICERESVSSSTILYHIDEWQKIGSRCPAGYAPLDVVRETGGQSGQSPVNLIIDNESNDSNREGRVCLGNGSNGTQDIHSKLRLFTEGSYGNNCPSGYNRLNVSNDNSDNRWNKSRVQWNDGGNRTGFFCMKDVAECLPGYNMNNQKCEKLGTREANCPKGYKSLTQRTCIKG